MPILARADVAKYAAQAGFSGNALNIALAVAQAESGFNSDAININKDGTRDRGLWQINNYWHPEVTDAMAFNPALAAAAAYRISNRGSNWSQWTTYTSGAYLKFMPSGTSGGMTGTGNPVNGKSNGYPKGQCTWWADERYHQLTGFWVPWSGNAKDWASQARQYSWNVSTEPVIPSIICLQGGVQGADRTFGHVGVAESINSDGTIRASSQNWGLTAAERSRTTYFNFRPGAGVSFISARYQSGESEPNQPYTPGLGGDLQNLLQAIGALFGAASGQISPLESVLDQVHQTLIEHPGLYGVALAVDQAEQFPGWVNLSSGPFDVIGTVRSVGASIGDNFLPFLIRGALVSLGMIILILLITKVVLASGEGALEMLGPLIGLL